MTAACRRLAMSLWTCWTRSKAGHRRAARILARSQAISDRKFCGRENFSKVSVRDAPQNASNLARRGMPMVARHIGDHFASRQGLASSGNVHLDAIARDFGPKILRPRNFCRNFRSESCRKTRAITHAAAFPWSSDALRTCLHRGKAGRRREPRISARSHDISDLKFGGREIFFQNFRSETR